MPRYLVSEQAAQIEIDANTAEDAAQAWVTGGYYGDRRGTLFHTIHTAEVLGAGALGPRVSFEIIEQPAEPPCTTAAHDWQRPQAIVGGPKTDPGVRKNGGGSITSEVCIHCGCSRVVDTWATDPNTGVQGLETIRYEAEKYAREVGAVVEAEVRAG